MRLAKPAASIPLRYNLGMAFLTRIDPTRGLNRWYSVTVQRGLFDACVVVCAWGSRRTAYQRLRVLPAGAAEEAESMVEQVVARKVQRGYRVAERVI